MFLESRITDKLVLLVEAEAASGIDKSQFAVSPDPDRILERTIEVIRVCADRMGAALSTAGTPAPVTMEVKFGVRVDGNAMVVLSKLASEAQFQVTFRWDA